MRALLVRDAAVGYDRLLGEGLVRVVHRPISDSLRAHKLKAVVGVLGVVSVLVKRALAAARRRLIISRAALPVPTGDWNPVVLQLDVLLAKLDEAESVAFRYALRARLRRYCLRQELVVPCL